MAYGSRNLTEAERNYAQFDHKELAVVFGVRHFHYNVFGQQFTVFTDHRPLLGVLGEGKSIPTMASGRMIRWALTLQAYRYQLRYRPAARHQNADGLSRLPCERITGVAPGLIPTPPEAVHLVHKLQDGSVTARYIAAGTVKDPVLARVRRYVANGWPDHCDNHVKPYFQLKDNLSLHEGCSLRGARVVVPPQARSACLAELHDGHPGVVRMKALARSYFWWPGLDKDIEAAVRACQLCQMTRPRPSPSPLHSCSGLIVPGSAFMPTVVVQWKTRCFW